MKKKRPDRNQQLLHWDALGREEKKRAIRAIDRSRTQLTPTRFRSVKELLLYLATIEGPDGIFAFVKTIAKALDWSEGKVGYTIQDAEDAGLLTSTRRGSKSNLFTIHLGGAAPPERTKVCVSETQTLLNSDTNFESQQHKDCATAPPAIEELLFTQLSSTSSSTAAVEVEEVERFKAKVREKLPAPINLDESVSIAMANGNTLEELRANARWFERNYTLWGEGDRAGVLSTRLRTLQPGMPHDKHWPYQGSPKR